MRSEAYMYMGQWTGLWLARVTFWILHVMCQFMTLTNYIYMYYQCIKQPDIKAMQTNEMELCDPKKYELKMATTS